MKNLQSHLVMTSVLVASVSLAAVSGCGDDNRDTSDAGGSAGDTSGTGAGTGSGASTGSGGGEPADTTAPVVDSTVPSDDASGVPRNRAIVAVFSERMAPSSIDDASMVVTDPLGDEVQGELAYAGTTLTFVPDAALEASSLYTVTVDDTVTDVAENALARDYVWSFTTGTTIAEGPLPVNLGTAGSYVLLAKAGISTTTGTSIVGNVGLSPAAESGLTGFSQTRDATDRFSTSSFVTGRLEASDMATPTPANLTAAISNMEAAYTDAAGRTLPDFTEHGAGDISGLTLVPGLYKWSSGVLVTTDVTLAGASNDVWIFQIAEDLTIESDAAVALTGGADAANVFWQVAGQAVFGTTSDVKGNVLCQTQIVLETDATFEGRALAQTAITLDSSAVTMP